MVQQWLDEPRRRAERPAAPAAKATKTARAADEDDGEETAAQCSRKLLSTMGVEAEVVRDEDDERITLEVKGPETGLVIGKKGQTLDALQYLVNKIVSKGLPEDEDGKPINVDAEGYRGRRAESLIELAHRLADKARATGRPVEAEPMSPADRRIIHVALAETPRRRPRAPRARASTAIWWSCRRARLRCAPSQVARPDTRPPSPPSRRGSGGGVGIVRLSGPRAEADRLPSWCGRGRQVARRRPTSCPTVKARSAPRRAASTRCWRCVMRAPRSLHRRGRGRDPRARRRAGAAAAARAAWSRRARGSPSRASSPGARSKRARIDLTRAEAVARADRRAQRSRARRRRRRCAAARWKRRCARSRSSWSTRSPSSKARSIFPTSGCDAQPEWRRAQRARRAAARLRRAWRRPTAGRARGRRGRARSAGRTRASRACSTRCSAKSARWSTPEPGTTRDLLEAELELDGVALRAGRHRRRACEGRAERVEQRGLELARAGAAAPTWWCWSSTARVGFGGRAARCGSDARGPRSWCVEQARPRRRAAGLPEGAHRGGDRALRGDGLDGARARRSRARARGDDRARACRWSRARQHEALLDGRGGARARVGALGGASRAELAAVDALRGAPSIWAGSPARPSTPTCSTPSSRASASANERRRCARCAARRRRDARAARAISGRGAAPSGAASAGVEAWRARRRRRCC